MPRPRRCFQQMSDIASDNNFLLIKYWQYARSFKLDVVCHKGHLTTKFLQAINSVCLKCKVPANKLTQQEVIERLAGKGFKLTEDYVDCNTPIKVMCKRGHNGETWLGHPGCAECSRIDSSYKLSEIQEIFANQSYKLVFDNLDSNDLGAKPSQKSFKYICSVGHEGQTDIRNFLNGKRCRKCWAKSTRQENHYAWNPELTEKDRLKRRHFPETREWRTEVFERDGYKCFVCQQLGYKLAAHHLDGWDKHPNQRFDVNNGITLCQKCHKDFHLLYGNRRNTKIQFEKWLESLSILETSGIPS